jgi:hypothetical protein
MFVLLDNSVPRGVARFLNDHNVIECRERNWDTSSNGQLLALAESAGFEVLITTDKNIRYQQNLKGRKIALVVLGAGLWRRIRPFLPQLLAAVNAATPGSYTEIEIPK